MEEYGNVIECKGNEIKVEVEKRQSCGDHCACASSSRGTMKFVMENSMGAKVGDRVRIRLADDNVAVSASIVFLIPIAGFFTGYFLAQWVAQSVVTGLSGQGIGIIGAVGGMLAGVGIVRKLTRKRATDKISQLLEIVTV